VANLKVHVNSTPSPKGEEAEDKQQQPKVSASRKSPDRRDFALDSCNYPRKKPNFDQDIAKKEFGKHEMSQLGMNQIGMNQIGMNQIGMNQTGMNYSNIDENRNITNLKTSRSLQNMPSTPKHKLDKTFYIQAIRSMKTRSMTQSSKVNQEIKQIEDLLNSSTVLFEDEDQMEI